MTRSVLSMADPAGLETLHRAVIDRAVAFARMGYFRCATASRAASLSRNPDSLQTIFPSRIW